jgi:hypothetical protein
MILFITIVLLTVTEAVHEGLAQRYRNGKLKNGWIPGVIEFAKLVMIAAMIPVYLFLGDYDWYVIYPNRFWTMFFPRFIIGWLCIRYLLFDPIYNLCAGNKIFHIGSVKLYDRIMKYPDRLWGNFFHGWVRIVLGSLGIGLIFQI